MSTESQEKVCDDPKPAAPWSQPVTSSPVRSIPLFVPALLSAVLLWLCFFPMNAGWLAWIALLPLSCLVRSPARARWVYPAAWFCGLVFFYSAVQWLRHADDRELFTFAGLTIKGGHLTWSSLALYCAFYVPLAVLLLRRLDRCTALPLALTLPVVWTALEFVRAHLFTGFPWYFLGHTQHRFLPLIQIADLGGAYLVTFLVAAVNGLLFELLCACERFRACFRLPERAGSISLRTQSIVLASLLVGALLYGFVRLGQEEFRDGPRVALIQGNLPQSLRNLASSTDEQQAVARYSSDEHFRKLADRAALEGPDLIVWPETSAPFTWEVMADGEPHEFSAGRAISAMHRWQTHLLLGMNSYNQRNDGSSVSYNSAILLRPTDPLFAGRYDKIHRVPFGEYVPMKDQFTFMNILAPYDYDYSIRPGAALTRFPLGPYRFGVLICFEDSDAYLARQYVQASPPFLDRLNAFLTGYMYGALPPPADDMPVDFLVNLSNDAWFLGSSEHDEHLAICRFRAVECRRSIARAVNMGISAVIDGSGRIVALPADSWEASKKIDGVVTHVIPLDHRRSLYARLGDWLPALCLLGMMVGIVRRPVHHDPAAAAATAEQPC